MTVQNWHHTDTLVKRLLKSGMALVEIPGFMRSLAASSMANPRMGLEQINQRLHYLGWTDVDLDDYTFQLALVCFENAGLNRLTYKSSNWYRQTFLPVSTDTASA